MVEIVIRNLRPIFIAAACLYFTGTPSLLNGCQICVPFPKKSVVDFLIESDTVILAREDPDRPFHLRTIEVLKGMPGDEQIDLFVDSTSRRLLAIYPERSVVVVKHKEKGESKWRRIGLTDKDLDPLLREILDSADAWEQAPDKRFEFFAQLLGHKNSQISTAAHLEVGRAPYAEIKRLGATQPPPLSREAIRTFLDNPRYIEWHALYLLLLSQSSEPEDRGYLLESWQSTVRFGTTIRLAALATVAIEIEGGKAIKLIESEYFHNASREIDELKEVFKALSVHGNGGRTKLRAQIANAYAILLAQHPTMAPAVVKDLVAWNHFDPNLGKAVARIAARKDLGFTFSTTLRLRNYAKLALAEKRGADL